ncbi:39S ribosomal protein L11, mitochondrial-like [Daphnia pulex]|uniref:Large ribosomal subunit protein uL11m n=3 Tax=Daphnia TaxID=6668 RepID=A0A4Y7MX52_DAPPU|nr:39S ribosomal protein L11, mitochondrial-like [Daphnia pulex]XP_046658154.1 39S ribosomal protein L11, mitochondrial-like [Daphnia pulicaria]CAG4640507.1 EOG090X0I63 [Daphnia pulex]SVE84006.1 EOG090X0I63 [Daphnia pulex]SVE84613.1 EOG090X0I63 [Daphnia pulex]SVE85238.1 EOG090X0I63 [Daphnia pulex]SVE85868.1 EOG090X0I63 [Daphnia pulicaria]
MSKVAKKVVKAMSKKTIAKIDHGNRMETYIPSGKAVAGPPLGPQLGQKNINIAAFCKEFNERTKDYKEGIPLPCRVVVNPDRTFDLTINQPPATYFLKQAAGIQRGAMKHAQEVAGKVSLKHVYEIAKIKQQDATLSFLPLETICKQVVAIAKSCGIEVVPKLDAEEYGEFLKERKIIVEEELKDLQAKKEARMLRTA